MQNRGSSVQQGNRVLIHTHTHTTFDSTFPSHTHFYLHLWAESTGRTLLLSNLTMNCSSTFIKSHFELSCSCPSLRRSRPCTADPDQSTGGSRWKTLRYRTNGRASGWRWSQVESASLGGKPMFVQRMTTLRSVSCCVSVMLRHEVEREIVRMCSMI